MPNRAAMLGLPIEKWQVNIMNIVMIFRTIMITLSNSRPRVGSSGGGEKAVALKRRRLSEIERLRSKTILFLEEGNNPLKGSHLSPS